MQRNARIIQRFTELWTLTITQSWRDHIPLAALNSQSKDGTFCFPRIQNASCFYKPNGRIPDLTAATKKMQGNKPSIAKNIATDGLSNASEGGAISDRRWTRCTRSSLLFTLLLLLAAAAESFRSASENGDTPTMVSRASRISSTKFLPLLFLLCNNSKDADCRDPLMSPHITSGHVRPRDDDEG